MNASVTSIATRSWVLGVLIPLVLTACGAVRPAEETGPVNVGYGEVDAEHVGRSVDRVEAEEEGLARTRSLADMLGRLPGVRVSVDGDALTVRIRGSSSFLGSEEPLVVVDGMEYRGALGMINPFDIDSIRVLKNAGETGVYGARGANGVILITTKSGRESGAA